MNVNTLLAKIKTTLGIGDYLRIKMKDKDIIEKIIIGTTLDDFNNLFKNEVILYKVKLKKLNESGLYKIVLPDNVVKSLHHNGMKIRGIKELGLSSENSRVGMFGQMCDLGAFANVGSFTGYGFGFEHMASSLNVAANVEALDVGFSHQFIEPDKLQFRVMDGNYEAYEYTIKVYTTHSKNLSTLGEKYKMIFEKICILDVKSTLWESELKHVNGTETMYTKVDLKIDEWAQAGATKQEYMKEVFELAIPNAPTIVGK